MMKEKILKEIKRVNGANIDHLCFELKIQLCECTSYLAELDEQNLIRFNTVALQWQLET